MSQLDSDTGFDSSKERELLSQAELVFQSSVESLFSDGVNISSNPSRLFDPGDIVPRWGESDIYKRISDTGEEYWYICTPVEVDFIYRYSSSGDIELEPVKCDVEMQTIIGYESSCCLVYAISDENWLDDNLRRGETALETIRKGETTGGYTGLLFFTELNGLVEDIWQFDEGVYHTVEFDPELFSKYCFGVYRVSHTKAGEDEPIYFGGELDEAVVTADNPDRPKRPGVPNLNNGNNDNGGSPYSGGGGTSTGSNATGSTGNPVYGTKGSIISYNKQGCFVGYNISKDCLKGAKQIMEKMGKPVPTNRINIATRSEDGKGIISKISAEKGVAMVISALNNFQSAIMGVTRSNFLTKSSNNNNATQHFILITGYQPYGNGCYFIYVETGRSDANWKSATSDQNRLYYDYDTGTISGENYKSPTSPNYIVTEIRTN